MAMNAHTPRREKGFWRTRTGIALCAFIGIAAVLLILEHRAHALPWLPFALLLACPLLHLFHGHGGHGEHHGAKQDKSDKGAES
jgi:hypothetical protein